MKLLHTMITETGLSRTNNEDAVGFRTPDQSWLRQSMGSLAVVSDGIGGLPRGEKASSMVVDQVMETYFRSARSPEQALQEAALAANNAVAAESIRSSQKMGATCTAAAILNSELYIMHVGDSRGYLFHKGEINQLTRDHTVAREMYESDDFLSSDQTALINPHALTKAMGLKKLDDFDGDVFKVKYPFHPGDMLLLCTDGLYLHISSDEIETLLKSRKDMDELSDHLIKTILQRGARDNFSFILMECQETN